MTRLMMMALAALYLMSGTATAQMLGVTDAYISFDDAESGAAFFGSYYEVHEEDAAGNPTGHSFILNYDEGNMDRVGRYYFVDPQDFMSRDESRTLRSFYTAEGYMVFMWTLEEPVVWPPTMATLDTAYEVVKFDEAAQHWEVYDVTAAYYATLDEMLGVGGLPWKEVGMGVDSLLPLPFMEPGLNTIFVDTMVEKYRELFVVSKLWPVDGAMG